MSESLENYQYIFGCLPHLLGNEDKVLNPCIFLAERVIRARNKEIEKAGGLLFSMPKLLRSTGGWVIEYQYDDDSLLDQISNLASEIQVKISKSKAAHVDCNEF